MGRGVRTGPLNQRTTIVTRQATIGEALMPTLQGELANPGHSLVQQSALKNRGPESTPIENPHDKYWVLKTFSQRMQNPKRQHSVPYRPVLLKDAILSGRGEAVLSSTALRTTVPPPFDGDTKPLNLDGLIRRAPASPQNAAQGSTQQTAQRRALLFPVLRSLF